MLESFQGTHPGCKNLVKLVAKLGKNCRKSVLECEACIKVELNTNASITPALLQLPESDFVPVYAMQIGLLPNTLEVKEMKKT